MCGKERFNIPYKLSAAYNYILDKYTSFATRIPSTPLLVGKQRTNRPGRTFILHSMARIFAPPRTRRLEVGFDANVEVAWDTKSLGTVSILAIKGWGWAIGDEGRQSEDEVKIAHYKRVVDRCVSGVLEIAVFITRSIVTGTWRLL